MAKKVLRSLGEADKAILDFLPTGFMEDLLLNRKQHRIVLLNGHSFDCSCDPTVCKDESGDVWIEFWHGEEEGGMVFIPTRSILYVEEIRKAP